MLSSPGNLSPKDTHDTDPRDGLLEVFLCFLCLMHMHIHPYNKLVHQLPCSSVVKNPLAVQETQVQSPGQEDPLQKGMAAHSSILAWEIPRTEKPGRL